MTSSRVPHAIVASVALVLGAPALPIGGLFVQYLRDYHGICGPYPTDIPALPCDFATYVERFVFGSAFEIVGRSSWRSRCRSSWRSA